jgi:hypothetical protein
MAQVGSAADSEQWGFTGAAQNTLQGVGETGQSSCTNESWRCLRDGIQHPLGCPIHVKAQALAVQLHVSQAAPGKGSTKTHGYLLDR